MNTPSLSPLQRYGPYIGICVVLALVLVVAPSQAPDRTNAFAGAAGDDRIGTADQFQDALDDDSTDLASGMSPDTTVASGGATPTGESSAAPTPGQPPAASSASAQSDGSVLDDEIPGHFPPDFREGIKGEDCSRREQLGADYVCMIVWEGDNGGATYKGVTREEIVVAYYIQKSDPAVDAVLAGGGLGSTREQTYGALDAYNDYFAGLSQTYGRTVKLVKYEGKADLNDAAAYRADAVALDQEVGAAIVLGAINPDLQDELARRGISIIGGAQDPGVFMRERAPFIFGLLSDGDTTNQHVAEFICKRLGPNSTADFSGDVIHPTIGARGQVKRKYSLAYPNGYWGNNNADDFVARLAKCGIQISQRNGYASDINTAGQQSTALTQKAIQEGITTQLCICDPLAPIYGTTSNTQQGYYPEYVITGYQLQDAEALARLYDQTQWDQAFGVSTLPKPVKKEDSAWYKVFKQYNDFEPSAGAALIYPVIQILYVGLEYAGPNLNPSTFAEGMYVIDVKATEPEDTTFGYTKQDYGGINDAREIWWDPNGTDPNGTRGVYRSVNDHWRWQPGEWPNSKTTVFRTECEGRGACGGPSW